ncbi:methylmalonyl-CoA epimerase [Corynebacterium sputi]|uniref:methylmalonyl-CoA epimerase n=1 Tax=Corynebacterium sputi TaxID=489915 RepID=UPI0004211907|nr:methylmalonyl-CoA epimerase [Corynebacterium sputi]
MSELSSSVTVPHEYVVAVDHVGIAVRDLAAACDFYLNAFGWVSHHEEVNEDQGIREAMVGPENAAEGDTLVQLIAPLDETSTIAKFIDTRGPGLQQYAVRVTDMDALMKYLASINVRVLYPAPRIGTGGSRINFVHPKDAGGVLLELVEPAN